MAKIHLQNLKIVFFRTTWPFLTKLGTKNPGVMVTEVCSNKGPRPLPKEDND